MSSEIYKAAITVATDSVHFVKLAAKVMKQTEWWKLDWSEFQTKTDCCISTQFPDKFNKCVR